MLPTRHLSIISNFRWLDMVFSMISNLRGGQSSFVFLLDGQKWVKQLRRLVGIVATVGVKHKYTPLLRNDSCLLSKRFSSGPNWCQQKLHKRRGPRYQAIAIWTTGLLIHVGRAPWQLFFSLMNVRSKTHYKNPFRSTEFWDTKTLVK